MRPSHLIAFALGAFIVSFSHPLSAQQLVEDYQALIKGRPLLTPVLAVDGNYLVGGSIDFFGDELSGAIVKIDSKGQGVAGFGKIVTNGDINHVVPLSNGQFMASGKFTKVNGQPCGKLVRFNADGTVDGTFNTNSGDEIRDFNIQSDGRVIIAGLFVDYATHGYANLARLNPDGSLDETFAKTSWFPTEILINGNDEIFLNLVYDFAKLTPSGDIDPSFNPDPGPTTSFGHLELLTDSTLLVASRDYSANLNTLYLLKQDGSIDPAFNNIDMSHQILTFTILSNGGIAVGGVFSDYKGQLANLVLFHADGTFDRILATTDVNSTRTVFEDPSGGIVLAGEFHVVNGVTNYYLARLNPDYSLDTEFKPLISRSYLSPGIGIQSDGKLIVAGGFDLMESGDDPRILRLNAEGTIDRSFNPEINAYGLLLELEVQPDNKILASGLSLKDDANRDFVRLLPDGQRDEAFDASIGAGPQKGQDGIWADVIRYHKSKIYLGGSFTSFNGQAYPNLVILDPDGKIIGPANKTLPANSIISDIEIQSDEKIVLVGWFPFSADFSPRIIRLLADGTVDSSFPGIALSNGFITDLAVDSHDRIVVIGGFEQINGTAARNLVRLNNDGTVDTTFDTGDSVPEDIDNTMSHVVVLPTDIIAISGSFEFYNDESSPGIVFIDPSGDKIAFDAAINPISEIGDIAFRNNLLYANGRIIFGDGERVSSVIKILFDLPVATSPLASEERDDPAPVFPNPFKDRIYIDITTDSGPASVKLFSQTGVLLMDRQSQSGIPMSLDVNDLQPGLFFVSVQTHDGRISNFKMVKN